MPERIRAALGLLTKYVPPEETLTAEDIEAARAAGLSSSEIRDVFYVGSTFICISKSADAFGWPVMERDKFGDEDRKALLGASYARMCLPG